MARLEFIGLKDSKIPMGSGEVVWVFMLVESTKVSSIEKPMDVLDAILVFSMLFLKL